MLASLLLMAAGCGDDSVAPPPDGPAQADAPRNDGPGSDAQGGDGMPGDVLPGDVLPGDGPTGDAPIDGIAPPDAAISDGGGFTTPVTPDRVRCAVAGGSCDTTTSKCCGMLTGGLLSFSCAPPATTGCSIDEGCDGTEDCTSGVCCGMGNTMGGFRTSCQAAPCAVGARQLCHNHTQCPAAQSSCCIRPVGGGGNLIGLCYAAGTEPAGARCDTP